MLDLAHELKAALEANAREAEATIKTASERFATVATELVLEFNAKLEARLQLLAFGRPSDSDPAVPKLPVAEPLPDFAQPFDEGQP